jgi:brefeldin A-resistance guanine nucleotide exchange factor 1
MAALSVDPVFLLINECTTVTSAMRKNARWAQSGVATILGTPSMESSDSSLAQSLGLRNRSGSNEMVCTKWRTCRLFVCLFFS